MWIGDDVHNNADFHGEFSWVKSPFVADGSDVPDEKKREWVELLDRLV